MEELSNHIEFLEQYEAYLITNCTQAHEEAVNYIESLQRKAHNDTKNRV